MPRMVPLPLCRVDVEDIGSCTDLSFTGADPQSETENVDDAVAARLLLQVGFFVDIGFLEGC